MAAREELNRLLKKAGVTPYRRVGKVRVAYDARCPRPTFAAAVEAVKAFAPALVDEWGEPPGSLVSDWRTAGLTPADVCDDPCPRGIDPRTCDPAWLLARCERYHFRLAPAPDGMTGVPLDGWTMDAIRQSLPAWFVDACRARRAELVAAVAVTA